MSYKVSSDLYCYTEHTAFNSRVLAKSNYLFAIHSTSSIQTTQEGQSSLPREQELLSIPTSCHAPSSGPALAADGSSTGRFPFLFLCAPGG